MKNNAQAKAGGNVRNTRLISNSSYSSPNSTSSTPFQSHDEGAIGGTISIAQLTYPPAHQLENQILIACELLNARIAEVPQLRPLAGVISPSNGKAQR